MVQDDGSEVWSGYLPTYEYSYTYNSHVTARSPTTTTLEAPKSPTTPARQCKRKEEPSPTPTQERADIEGMDGWRAPRRSRHVAPSATRSNDDSSPTGAAAAAVQHHDVVGRRLVTPVGQQQQQHRTPELAMPRCLRRRLRIRFDFIEVSSFFVCTAGDTSRGVLWWIQ